MGVTCLLSYRTDQVFSGSVDKTIKLWNVATGQLLFAFHRHDMAVSTLHLSQWKDANDTPEGVFLFSGGQDSTVRAWDILRKRSLFEISVGGDLCPTAINFIPEANELSVLALPMAEGPAEGRPSAADLGQLQLYKFSGAGE
jgi:WD40 repeat protein